ncbi:MAG: ATP adenylyltransferase, partial [Synechococcus sp. BS307-5m-G39]|nr:ATP adenylyltransferase [Synechococcus sp. BS307-5m-G39]
MALIRRRKERASGFSLNALGFAGYLLATENSDLGWLEQHGGERLLQEVVSGISDATDDSES